MRPFFTASLALLVRTCRRATRSGQQRRLWKLTECESLLQGSASNATVTHTRRGADMASNREWHGDRIAKAVLARGERNMRQAVAYLEGEARRSINKGQPTRRSGRSVIGLAPSAPGSPPKRVTGRLIRSLSSKVKAGRTVITGTYGAGTIYARRLELGFSGTDRKGRNVRQAARPFLRPALIKNKRTVARILAQD